MSGRVCSVVGCDRTHYAKGFCNPHWRRWKRNGTPGGAFIHTPRKGICEFAGCERTHSAKGLCATHYAQHRRGNDLAPILERTPEAVAHRKLDRTLRKLYGIGADEYHDLLQAQGGGCAICGTTENGSGRRLAVDHDHDTDAVRGVLCENCNFGLGSLQDSISLLENAIHYLRSHRS